MREAGKVLRDRRIGYLLLLPHGVTPVVALWWPAASSWTPFLQLPFCAYFATVAVEYRRLALEWGAKEGEDEDLDPEGSRPCGKLFDALWVIAGTLTVCPFFTSLIPISRNDVLLIILDSCAPSWVSLLWLLA